MPGSWSSWVLSDQESIDTCAEELMAAGWYNTVKRGRDMATPPNPVRSMQIYDPVDEQKHYDPVLGQAVVLMGSMLLVMPLADYEASPFYEAP